MEKRKNIALRAATVLCVLVLFCAAFVGGTFARYTTNDGGNDLARVAKWGIDVAIGGTLFGDNYTANGAANGDEIQLNYSASVSAIDNADIVAPGTQNTTGMKIAITGQPEVQYDVKAVYGDGVTIEDIFLKAGKYGTMVAVHGVTEANFGEGTYYTLDAGTYTKATSYTADTDYYEIHDSLDLATDYYPIVWTVEESGKLEAIDTDGKNLVTIAAEMLANINNADGDAEESAAGSYTLTWAWAFSQNDKADTILGNLAAGTAVVSIADDASTATVVAVDDGVTNNLGVAFGMNVTVEQVD